MGNAGPPESNAPQDEDIIKRTSFILPSMDEFSPHDAESPTEEMPVLPDAIAEQPPQLTLPSATGGPANPRAITKTDIQPPQPHTTAIQPRITRPLAATDVPSTASSPTATTANQTHAPKRLPRWFLILCIVVLALLALGAFEYTYFNGAAPNKGKLAGQSGIIASPTGGLAGTGIESFQVGAHPLIVIQGHGGNVNVRDGSAGMVIVQASGGSGQGPMAEYTQTHDQQGHDLITINTEPGDANVNYDVTMPRAAQIHVTIDSGSITVNGASGAMLTTQSGSVAIANVQGALDARTVSGDITASAVKGQVTIATENGSINVNNVNGQLKAITQNGDVVVSGATLSGQSVLQTNYGSVRFAGAIDPRGTYIMATLSGDVDLTLPDDAAFQLAARTGSGSVQNAFGSNTTGNAPRAQVTITIGSGSITMNKASMPLT